MRVVLLALLVAALSACGISEDRVPRRVDASPLGIETALDRVDAGRIGT